MTRLIWKLIIKTSRVWKVALAAGLAWEVAEWIGFHRPYFAPLAAILCLQVTVAESVAKGLQRVLGIVCGVILADLTVRFIGLHGWSIALLVFMGISIAMLFRLGPQAIPQVGVSAMMVLTVGSQQTEYSIERVINTVIGAAIAILLNMVVFPPDFTDDAIAAIRRAASELQKHFIEMSSWLESGAMLDVGHAMKDRMHQYLDTLHTTVHESDKAMQALKYSPLLHRRRRRLEHLHDGMLRLRQGYAHAAGVLRTLLEWETCIGIPDERRHHWAHRCQEAAAWMPPWVERLVHAALGEPGERAAGSPDHGHAGTIESRMTTHTERFLEGAIWNDFRQLEEDLHAPSSRD